MKIEPNIFYNILTLLLVSLSFIWCLIINPGHLFWDSCIQWQWAMKIRNSGVPASLHSLGISTHWPIFMTLIKVPFLYLPQGVFLYIFLQSFFCGTAVIFLFRRMNPDCYGVFKIVPIVLFLFPVVLNYSVFHSADTVVFIGLMFAFGTIITPLKRQNKRDSFIFVSSCMLMSLARYNAIFLVIPLCLYFFVITPHKRILLVALSCAVMIIVTVRLYEYTASHADVSTEGIEMRLWEMRFKIVDKNLDGLFVQKDFKDKLEKANRVLDVECYERGRWCKQWVYRPYQAVDSLSARKEYLNLFLRHPLQWWSVNLKFIIYGLGLPSALPETEIGKKNIHPSFSEMTMIFNGQRDSSLRVLKFTQTMIFGFFSRPYILLILTTALCFVLGFRRIACFYLVCFSFYLLPLFLGAPARDFRYSFPIIGLSYTLIACLMVHLIQNFLIKIDWLRKK